MTITLDIKDKDEKKVNGLLTKTPFISLNTTPLITIGEFGSSVFSCSRRQPSCLTKKKLILANYNLLYFT
jgi:hypothetical protein